MNKSQGQKVRQSTRDRAGRYESAPMCGGLCGRKLPLVDYYSDRRADDPRFPGLHAICGRCCDQFDAMSDEQLLALLSVRRLARDSKIDPTPYGRRTHPARR